LPSDFAFPLATEVMHEPTSRAAKAWISRVCEERARNIEDFCGITGGVNRLCYIHKV